MARPIHRAMPLGQMVAISAASHRFTKTGDFGRETFRSDAVLLLYIHPTAWNHRFFKQALVVAVEALLELPHAGAQADLSAALLGAILTAGFEDPERFMRHIAEKLESTAPPEPLTMQGGMLLFRNANHPFAPLLQAAMRHAAQHVQPRTLTSIKEPHRLDFETLKESSILAAVCAFTVATASKAVSNPASATQYAVARTRHLIEGASALLDSRYLLTGDIVQILAHLIKRAMTLRWVIVGLVLSARLEKKTTWLQAVDYFSVYLQDSGIAAFVLIRGLLLANRISELTFPVFRSDLIRYKEACYAHAELAEYGPYIRFLELPESVLFQTGKFPNLVEFMRGFAAEINPRATELMTLGGQDVRVRSLFELGVHAGHRAAATVDLGLVREIMVNFEAAMEASREAKQAQAAEARGLDHGGMNKFIYGAQDGRF